MFRRLVLILAALSVSAVLTTVVLSDPTPDARSSLFERPTRQLADDGGTDVGLPGSSGFSLARHFDSDPFADPQAVVAGAASDRLGWQLDDPAYPGDRPGSLRAIYDSNLPAGWFGFTLPAPAAAGDTFAAAAAFVIDSDGFAADPDGFFQISWGLWNSATTGLDRTGSFDGGDFAPADTFELIEFDYFPNVSAFFGGPFVAPSLFGASVGSDAFSNFTSVFDLEVQLPLDVPLLAVLEHRPGLDALVAQVYRIVDVDSVFPIDGAVGVASVVFLAEREYELDTLGLTLWQDGFGGATPALTASVDFHVLAAISDLPGRPEDLLELDDENDDEDDEDDD